VGEGSGVRLPIFHGVSFASPLDGIVDYAAATENSVNKMAEESLTVRASYWPSLGAWSDTLLDKPEDSDYSQAAEKFKLVVEHTKHQVGHSGLTWAIGEEGLTVALMALLFANARWVAGIKPDPRVRRLQWRQYSKNGKGAHAESESGADFALIIESPNGSRWRLGIFQAKRATRTQQGWQFTRGPEITGDFEPRDKKGDPKSLQFLTLVNSSIGIHEQATGRSHTVTDLKWVHYLGYIDTDVGYSLAHHPVAEMATQHQLVFNAFNSLLDKQPIQGSIPGTEYVVGEKCWFDHLCEGWLLAERDPKLNWLEFDPANTDVISLLPVGFDTLSVSVLASPEAAQKIIDLLHKVDAALPSSTTRTSKRASATALKPNTTRKS
jgi:hypothetical protein